MDTLIALTRLEEALRLTVKVLVNTIDIAAASSNKMELLKLRLDDDKSVEYATHSLVLE